MAKKVEEVSFDLDDSALTEIQLTETTLAPLEDKSYARKKQLPSTLDKPLINCLRNEIINVKHIPKQNGMISNPKHILFGGMAESAIRKFTVPRLSSGSYVNPVTDSEKEFLEEVMGLEFNALSIHKKIDNYWENNMVRLTKGDNFLDLSDPEGYIKYKILLTNKNFIAPSLQSLSDAPKATYQFVIVAEGEENKSAQDNMSATMKSYKEFGKIEEDIDVLRLIIETIDGRPTAPNSKIEFLQTKANTLIQADSKLFLKVVTDPLLNTKVLIKRSIEAGIVSNRGNYLYLREDNSPLCEHGQEPTLSIAAVFLNNPKHQEIKFMLEAKLK